MPIYCLGRRKIIILLLIFSICLLVPTMNLYNRSGDIPDGPNSSQDNEDGSDKDVFSNGYSFDDEDFETNQKIHGGRYVPPHRVVHFDLKGAPPKVSYFKYLFPLIKEAGATAVLMEYEDTFPYTGALKNICAEKAYTPGEIKEILKAASDNNLKVIPLVQTFGHMEHVLKLEEFRELREVPIYPQSICPSRDKGFEVIKEMIDQMLNLHPNSTWLHIGLDEVYQLGQCLLCSERINKANSDPDLRSYQDGRTLFLEHVARVASYVKYRKKKIPIMWDDMLRSFPTHTLKDSGIGDLVEPMVWVYIEDIDRFVDSVTWATYAEVFKHIWTASAYKGAFGERMFMVNLQRHVGNHLSWLEVMRRESSVSHLIETEVGGEEKKEKHIRFRGIALCGWSRYDHFAVLCELLPTAIPSLILNLNILRRGAHDEKAIRKTNSLLECPVLKSSLTPESLLRDPFQGELSRCGFLGSNLYALMSSYNSNKREIESIVNRVHNQEGWMTSYNVKHQFSSPYRVHETMKAVSFFPGILHNLENQMQKTLAQYYDSSVVEEWIEQNITPLQNQIEELEERSRILTSPTAWPRRPLH